MSGKSVAQKQQAAKKTATKAPVIDKRRKKKRTETFALYIYKVLKQVHPETGISKSM